MQYVKNAKKESLKMNDDEFTKMMAKQEAKEGPCIDVHRFMVEFTIYPNGKVFPRMFPVGHTKKEFSQKKHRTGEKAQTVLVDEEEVY